MKLIDVRKESGLKVKKIAELLGISRRHYYNLENGNTTFTIEKLDKLSKILNIDIIELKDMVEGENERIN